MLSSAVRTVTRTVTLVDPSARMGTVRFACLIGETARWVYTTRVYIRKVN